jgi:hypothetical protein
MEIIKGPAKQPKTAPAQVRDGEAIEGVLDRHSEFRDDPIPPLWFHYTVVTAIFVS